MPVTPALSVKSSPFRLPHSALKEHLISCMLSTLLPAGKWSLGLSTLIEIQLLSAAGSRHIQCQQLLQALICRRETNGSLGLSEPGWSQHLGPRGPEGYSEGSLEVVAAGARFSFFLAEGLWRTKGESLRTM